MKKIILVATLIALCAPVFAQQTLYDGFYSPSNDLIKAIKSSLSRILPEENANWVDAVRSEERLATSNGPLGSSVYGFPARTFKQTLLERQVMAICQKRSLVFRALLANHAILHTYKFKVTNPKDVVDLNDTQLQFLHDFLRQPTAKKSFNAVYAPAISHPKSAETQLTFTVQGKKLIFLINSRPEERAMYFFADAVPQE